MTGGRTIQFFISLYDVNALPCPQVGSPVEIRVLIARPSLLNMYNLVWSRDGVPLSPSNRYTFSPSRDQVVSGRGGVVIASLTISSVVLSDSALYEAYFSGQFYFD